MDVGSNGQRSPDLRERRVVFLGNYQSPSPHVVFEKMAASLAKSRIAISVDNRWSDEHIDADLLVFDEPLPDSDELLDCRILGQRTLNRRTRLDVAARCGAPVAPFGGPRNDQELDELAALWGSDCAVLKYDWSSRRRGVFLWPLQSAIRKPFPQDFDPEADVFMAFQGSDPQTYKVDAFGGVLLGAYVLKTRDMRSPAWETVLHQDSLGLDRLPDKTRRQIEAVSVALLDHGAGYSSFDLMRTGDEYRIIEINTCSVGTGIWKDLPQQYADAYGQAIVETLQQIDRIPRYRDLRDAALRCGNDSEAVELPGRTTAGAAAVEAASSDTEPWKSSIPARFMKVLERSDRVSGAEMRATVTGGMKTLLRHAREQVPFYSDRLGMLFSPGGTIELRAWKDVPVVRRADVAGRRADLTARVMPRSQGSVSHNSTAGTEYAPMTVSWSSTAKTIASCINMRFLSWHGVSFADSLATIRRPNVSGAAEDRKWAPRFAAAERGPEFELSAALPVAAQLEWLSQLGPVWLTTRPSLAQQLALKVKEEPRLKPNLRGIFTSGEVLTDDQRRVCRDFLGHAPQDIYALAEVGGVALQCPQSDAYHVQTETVLVEVLDREGRGCPPGATGRLVVTPLYNMAMPLIRYETGDLATAGDSFAGLFSENICVCGRRLPRLQAVLGRARNQLVDAGGRRLTPAIDSSRLHDLTGARLWQLVQNGVGRFVLRLDAHDAGSGGRVAEAGRYVTEALGTDGEVTIERGDLSSAAAARRFEPFLRV